MLKKNNKGFTLIEVIAVVTILGILSIMVVPKIFELVTDSRKNIYVEDAIRLISKAQFTMNSKSVKIDKPDKGEVIIFSMKYLSSADFQNPPNGGSYLTESSFVVVKNVNGNYVYSAMLVEKDKDGQYIGVELSTEKALNSTNALKHVKYFNVNEIAYVDTTSGIEGGSFLDANYISNNINGDTTAEENSWQTDDDDKIIGYYNNEAPEEEVITDTVSPRVSAKFSSSGSLKTTLTISATDADNDTNELKVFIKISHNGNDSYPAITGTGEAYGSGAFFTKSIDFEKYGFSYTQQETAYVYIVVVDPQKNFTRKRLAYDIHFNEPPQIETFTVTKNPVDSHNMPKARIVLGVTDDMDASENLQICFSQNKDATSCSTYKSYNTYFGMGDYYYTFKDSSGKDIIEPTGATFDLKVFVKDSFGDITTATATYKMYKNLNPELTTSAFGNSCAVTGLFLADHTCDCPSTKCNGLKVIVNFTAKDDVTPADDLTVRLVEIASDGTEKNPVTMTYAQYRYGDHQYTFSGGYDGKNRKLKIEIKDQYGKSTSKEVSLTNVYTNQKPTFNVTASSFITSAHGVCTGSSACEGNGGSYDVDLNFTVLDDLTDVNSIKVCISENKDDCTEAKKGTSTFVNYSSVSKHYTFTHPDITNGLIYPDDQIIKHLYVAMVDNYGVYQSYNNLNPIDYAIYHNSPPAIKGTYSISSTAADRNVRTVILNFNNYGMENGFRIEDDFNDFKVRFCYKIDSESSFRCTSYQSFSQFQSQFSNYFEFKNADGSTINYNGQEISTKIQAKDNYGDVVNSSVVKYKIFADGAPIIDTNNTYIESSTASYNHYIAYVHFKVTDFEDTYSVCITAGSTCPANKYQINGDGRPYDGTYGEVYTITVDGHELAGWDEEFRDENTHKQLTLFVKDSNGNVVSKVLNYDLYHLCSNESNMTITDAEPTYAYVSGNKITPSYCQGACYKTISSSPNTSVFKKTNNKFGTYSETYIYQDTLVGYTCPVSNNVSVGCNYVDCFNTGTTANPNVIAMELEESSLVWYYSNQRVTKSVKVDKPYCENLGTDSYFYPGDVRCDSEYCPNKASEYCVPVINAEEQADIANRNKIAKNYNEAMAVYNAIRTQASYLYYRIKEKEPSVTSGGQTINAEFHAGIINYLDSCALVKSHQGNATDDVTWRNNLTTTCTAFDTCTACHGSNPPPASTCNPYRTVDCSTLEITDPDQLILCDALLNYPYCQRIDTITATFLSLYNNNHHSPRPPLFVTQAEYDANYSTYISQGYTDAEIFIKYDKATHLAQCKQEQTNICKGKFGFCSQAFTSVKKVVSCSSSDKDIGPIFCRKSDYLNGYCLTNDSTCTANDTDCKKVCYKSYNCQEETENRPVTFTCHGYYSVYQSSRDGSGISLQKTGMRVCPEFMGNFSQFYQYNSSSSTPFIEFNPSEIG